MKILITGTKEFQQCDLYPKGSIHEVEYVNKDTDEVFKDKRGIIDYRLKFEKFNELISINDVYKCPCGCELIFLKSKSTFIPDIDGKFLISIRCFERKYIPNRDQYRKAIIKEVINSLNMSINE